MSKLAARVLTGASLALGAAALVWLESRFPPGRVVLVAVTAIALLASWELDHMGALRGRGLGLPLYCASLGLAALWAFGLLDQSGPLVSLLFLYGAALGLTFPGHLVGTLVLRVDPGAPRRTPFSTVLAGVWLLPPLFALLIVERVHGLIGLAVLLVLAKIGDNAGYFVGRSLGKRHPFPNLSPGKTVAGCVASFVAGCLAGTLLLPFTLGERGAGGAFLGAAIGGAVNLAAQAGDLSKSWVKRRAGVKDSSRLLGPAGGVIDVIDSFLLATPVALLSWSWAYGPGYS